MATLILVRHGRTTANATGLLAGRSAGVSLDDTGRTQARTAGERLAPVRLAALVSSPMERTRQTATAIARLQEPQPGVILDRGLIEADYGEWTGRPIKELTKEPLWKVVQTQPSAVAFPGGETMPAMAARAVAAVRRRDAALTLEQGAGAVWAAVSHGDLIKAILADALGMHLDAFQRISVDPGSISIVRYTDSRPFLLASNTHAGDLSWLRQPPKKRRRSRAADPGMDGAGVLGGGAGPASTAGE